MDKQNEHGPINDNQAYHPRTQNLRKINRSIPSLLSLIYLVNIALEMNANDAHGRMQLYSMKQMRPHLTRWKDNALRNPASKTWLTSQLKAERIKK
jgi:hypothetical protein